jgi:tetratricopeptide (TPR) repeat protein
MEIYIQKFGSQQPIDEQQVLHLLNTGELLAKDLACVKGMQEWQQLGLLPGIPPLIKEIYYLQLFLTKAGAMLNIWRRYEDNILLYKKFEAEVADWEKSVNEFNHKFPNQPLGISGKVWLYFYQALLKVKSNAFTIFDDDADVIDEVITEWQKENAEEAIALLDNALEFDDKPEFHLLKAMPLLYLRRYDELLEMTEYVLENFEDNEAACNEAVRLIEIVEEIIT